MAGKTYDMKTRISLMGDKEYKQAVSDINRQLTVLKSGLSASQAAFKGQEGSMEALRDKHQKLAAIYAAQAEKVEMMAAKLELAKEGGKASAKELDNLTIALNKAKGAMNGTAADIAKTEAELAKLEDASGSADTAADGMTDAMKKAGKATDEAGEAADDAEGKTDGLRDAMSGAADVAAGALKAGLAAASAIASLGAAALKGGQEVTQMGTDFTKANNQLSAMTGATGAELAAMGTIANEVWRNNFGENIGEVNEALATTKTNTGLVGDALKQATESGYLLRDTFGFEFAESSRAAAALMNQFGISSEQAYNLIAIGAQKGANQNGDLLDVLSEYAPKYAELGLTADQFMQTLVNGADAGVFSIDKVGDAVKEFSIRAIDGSDTTNDAFKALGLNAKQLSKNFAAGGPSAQKAFSQVVAALQKVKDPLKQSQIAVALFGTQYEDLGPQVLDILGSIEGATFDTVDALGQINGVRYDDLENAMEGAKRAIQSELLPAAQTMSQKAATMVNAVTQALSDGFQPDDIKTIGQTVASTLIEGITELRTLVQENEGVFSDAISQVVNIMASVLPGLIDALLPAAMGLLQSVVDAVASNAAPIASLAVQIVTSVANFLIENAPKLLDAAVSIVVGLVDGLTASLPQLIPVAVQMMVNLATGLIDAIPQLAARLPEIIDAIWQGLTSVDWAALGTQLLDAIMSSLGTIGTMLGGLFTEAWTAIQAIDWAAVGTTVQNAVANVGTWLSGKFTEAWTAIQAIDWAAVGTTVQNAVANVGTWLSGKFTEAWTAIQSIDWATVGTTVQNAVSDVGTWLASKFTEGWEAVKAIDWVAVGTTIGTGVGDVGNWLLTKFTEGRDAVKAIDWASVGTSITDALGTAATWITDTFSGLIEDVKTIAGDIWAGLTGGIASAASAAKDTLLQPFNDVITWIKGLFGIASPSTVLSEIGGFMLDGLGAGLLAGVESVLSVVGDVFGRIWNAIKKIFGFGNSESEESKDAKQAGQDIMTGLKDGITGSEEDLKTAVKAAAQSALQAIKDAFGVADASATATKEIGTAAVTGLTAGITDNTISLTTAATALGTAVTESIKTAMADGQTAVDTQAAQLATNLLTKLNSTLGITGSDSSHAKTTGAAVANGVATGMRTAGTASKYSSAASAIRSAALDALRSALGISGSSASKFESVGTAIANGVARGINNGSSKISSAARSAARAAYNAAKRELGISSPSRKMAEIGQWFDAGFAQGIERNMSQVIDSANRLATMAADTTAQTRTTTAAASFNLDYDRLGESVAKANKAAGIGTAVLRFRENDRREFGRAVEPYTSRAAYERTSKTAQGRAGRMVLVR